MTKLEERMSAMEATIEDLRKGVSKAQSHANDARITSQRTLTILQEYIKKCDERYSEGRQDHQKMWDRIDAHQGTIANWRGIAIGVIFILASLWTMIEAVLHSDFWTWGK